MDWAERACVGLRVVALRGVWEHTFGEETERYNRPVAGVVYTINMVANFRNRRMFALEELEHDVVFDASGFRPAHPTSSKAEKLRAAYIPVLAPEHV